MGKMNSDKVYSITISRKFNLAKRLKISTP